MALSWIRLVVGWALLGLVGFGCAGGSNSPLGEAGSGSANGSRGDTASAQRALECPLTHQTLDAHAAKRQFAGHDVLFLSEAEASAFDEMPGDEKRVLAARQTLARHGVVNEFGPVSGHALPIDAKIIAIDGIAFGFASAKDLAHFENLPKHDQSVLVAPFFLNIRGVANTHCPINGTALAAYAPTMHVRGVLIGFDNTQALESFKTIGESSLNETIAAIVLREQGVENTVCPITSLPLRLDSPLLVVDDRLIGLRNIEATRQFNQLTQNEQRRIIDSTSPSSTGDPKR